MEFFNNVGKKLNKVTRTMSDRTRDTVELTKLTADMHTVNSELKELYEQLGRCYYETLIDKSAAVPEELLRKIRNLLAELEDIGRRKQHIMQQARCASCGAAIPDNGRFCPACGTRVAESAPQLPVENDEDEYCPDCGAQRRPGAMFCEICGHSFSAETAPEVLPEPEPEEKEPVCPACGAPRPEGAKFCESCGYNYAAVEAPSEEPALPDENE